MDAVKLKITHRETHETFIFDVEGAPVIADDAPVFRSSMFRPDHVSIIRHPRRTTIAVSGWAVAGSRVYDGAQYPALRKSVGANYGSPDWERLPAWISEIPGYPWKPPEWTD